MSNCFGPPSGPENCEEIDNGPLKTIVSFVPVFSANVKLSLFGCFSVVERLICILSIKVENAPVPKSALGLNRSSVMYKLPAGNCDPP